jgi:putative ABC transport system permease protein
MQYRTIFKVGIRYILRHPWQSGLLVLGITLGVAVMVAIDLANASASRAFDLSTEAISGHATHQIVGGPTGFDEQIYTRLQLSGKVKTSTPVVLEYVSAQQLGNRPFTLLGVDPFTDGPFRNYLGGRGPVPIAQLREFLTQPGAILLSTDIATRYGLVPCQDLISNPQVDRTKCTLTIEVNGTKKPAYLVGLIDPPDNLTQQALDAIILTDIATAQEMTGRIGHIDRIDLILPEGTDRLSQLAEETAQATISSMLPPDVNLQTVASRSGTVQEMTNAFRVNLTALSLLALLVGLFLIYNTITFSVIQRRPMFGTLRCLGVTRKEVFLLVITEALVVGVIGAVLGILLGIFMGQGAVRLVTQTINDLFFVINVRGVQIPASSLIKGGLIGVIATILTAAPPAWEAASVPPRAALYRSSLEDKARKIVVGVSIGGLIFIAIGALLLLLIPTNNLVISFGGTFAVIVGFAMLTPIITEFGSEKITPLFEKIWGVLGRIAPRDIVKSISRTSIAIAALMVAVSVTIGVSLMISSFRYTVESWLTESLQGDIYISAPGQIATQPGGVLNPEIVQLANRTPGVDEVAQLRAVTVDSPAGPIHMTAIDHPVRDPRLFLASVGSPEVIWQQMQQGSLIISEPFANRYGIPFQGGTVEMFTDHGPKTFPVAGVFSDYASTQGTIRMAMNVYQENWNDSAVSALAIFLTPGTDVQTTTRTLQDQSAEIQRVFVRPNFELRQEALSVFDRTFAITGAMRILATLVAFIGVLSTMLSLQLEKQRQMGILRSVGLTIRQMWGLVLIQTGLMGGIAGVLSLPTGYVLSLILVYIINRRSFGWTLQMQVSIEPFLMAILVAISAALLAGIYPAYKVSQMATAEALRSE